MAVLARAISVPPRASILRIGVSRTNANSIRHTASATSDLTAANFNSSSSSKQAQIDSRCQTPERETDAFSNIKSKKYTIACLLVSDGVTDS